MSAISKKLPEIGAGIAVISGTGILPRLLAEKFKQASVNYRVVLFGNAEFDWARIHPTVRASFSDLPKMFDDLRASNCSSVVCAGGMVRPRLGSGQTDTRKPARTVGMREALAQGDDATLRFFAGMIESNGLKLIAPQLLLDDLVARPGVLTDRKPTPEDKEDARRAAEIVRALGEVDVGQGAVVDRGICLAVESIQGTDSMLQYLEHSSSEAKGAEKGNHGLLYKAAKPGQDTRIDFPAIGPQTVILAAQAGLAGIVVEAGGTFILKRPETVLEANRLGLFLWGRRGPDE